ncbi:MIP/aquaporin family protein [Mucilaginibacter sp.]|uniref:MIP/aquaporin family protein n=1 Tax=Mucilaginibacter sp. TaxID=1882438 RepID=UPI003D1488B0
MKKTWKTELQKYVDEARGLGLFMISAAFFDAFIQYPGLPFRHLIASALLRRFLVGLAMGLTALYIFTSKFGKQSGAYINPAVTLVRYNLGDIGFTDAIGYTIFQLIGGSLGVYLAALLFPVWMSHPDINYVVTIPGKPGIWVAFVLEFFISFLLIAVVLFMGIRKSWDKYTSYAVSALITTFITFEAPYSGMSMNPARTFASAIVAGEWKSFWLYCTAPVLGMLAGEVLYLKTKKYFTPVKT